MSPHLGFWTAGIDHAILRNVIVVADALEASCLVAGFQCFYREVLVNTCGTAMYHDQIDFLGFFMAFFGLLKCLICHTDLTDLTDFDSYGIFPVRLGEYRCLQRKRIREIREIRVGDQEGSGQDEQVSVQGDDLTMLNFIPDVPSDYSGLHPADALSLVSDARRLGLLQAYIVVSCGSATALVGVFASSGSATTLAGVFSTRGSLVGIRGGAIS